ncbi:hypothetical protein LPY66_02935 [Dehalobacter sp. DCM]|uniref:YkvI family membrane protein n=1 Tax=Dehalobacter sp. DCM TaxID=2907827 RepID=UPI0030819424|nr:hypothetical protein LPY66_02935 [Dehalobacter sp. DCM]
MKKTKQFSTLSIAAAFIGTIVGAGFATGQEVLQFFSFYGMKGFIGIVVSAILFSYFGILIMFISKERHADSHLELVRFTFGKRLGVVMDWFITISFLGVLVVMAAGSGAVAEEQLGLPPFIGSIAVILLSFLTVSTGVKNVIRVIGLVVPFLLCAVIGVALFSLMTDPLTASKIALLESIEAPSQTSWPFSAILYVSYNIILAVAILSPLGVEANSRKNLLLGGILGGLGLGIGILAIDLAVISGVPEILPFQVPMVYLASKFSPLFALVFGLILILEIYTTAVSILYGFAARMAYGNRQRILWAGLASLAAVIAAQYGFSKIISTVYPLMGFFGFVFLGGLLWTHLKDHLSGVFHIQKK